MNLNPELIKRAFFVIGDLAFEVIDDSLFGKKYILVTDCLDETQRAQYIEHLGKLKEKVSSFRTDKRIAELAEVVSINEKYFLEVLHG